MFRLGQAVCSPIIGAITLAVAGPIFGHYKIAPQLEADEVNPELYIDGNFCGMRYGNMGWYFFTECLGPFGMEHWNRSRWINTSVLLQNGSEAWVYNCNTEADFSFCIDWHGKENCEVYPSGVAVLIPEEISRIRSWTHEEPSHFHMVFIDLDRPGSYVDH